MSEDLNTVHVLEVKDGKMGILHPPTCIFNKDAVSEKPMYSCGVGWEEDEFTAEAFFRSSDTFSTVPLKWEIRPLLIDGRYFIERFVDSSEKHWLFPESDLSGLRLLYPEEAQSSE